MDVRGKVISADCHIDLIWLPPELFTEEAPAHLKERMPYVDQNDQGRDVWVSRGGAYFGLVNGMGSAGREYVPGVIHRSDRMADKGLYEDGAKGIRRLTEPELRVRDQDLDGVRGEVLYGILGAANRLNDPEAAVEVMRIYNEWLADFSETHPDRFAGIACIPNHDIEAAVAEIERVAKRGAVRGLEISNTLDMKPLYHGHWNPLWEAVDACGLPVHIHTIGGKLPETEGLTQLESRAAFATFITGFQLKMADKLMEAIYGGVLERYPRVKLVIGEAGIGWITLRPRAHGPRMGGPVPGPRAQDEALRVLAPPVLRHLPERPHRRSPHRRPRRGQRHVGLRLPPPRRASGPTARTSSPAKWPASTSPSSARSSGKTPPASTASPLDPAARAPTTAQAAD